ncbi:MAG: MBL fold metallo-hydrolase [Acidobacteria bacterium]|nr:MBL fold metallo-hydrolase [Acidobacteriota bacterium]
MNVRFWGVRGSTPTPQRENLRYGGNTSCVEVRIGGELFVFDCGTGFRVLGNELRRKAGRSTIHARIFLSHYHWDHIQGIPFFTPLYNPDNHFDFYSFRSLQTDVERALEDQMMNPYFPVEMKVMRAHRRFHHLEEETRDFDRSVRISTKRLNHPQGCFGYRLEHKRKILVYATDNEPGDPQGDQNVRALAEDADLLIYDSQYTPHEYQNGKQSWGHSTWEEAVAIARDARVKNLVLFHHDPEHNDKEIDAILRTARKKFSRTVAAREGLKIRIS